MYRNVLNIGVEQPSWIDDFCTLPPALQQDKFVDRRLFDALVGPVMGALWLG